MAGWRGRAGGGPAGGPRAWGARRKRGACQPPPPAWAGCAWQCPKGRGACLGRGTAVGGSVSCHSMQTAPGQLGAGPQSKRPPCLPRHPSWRAPPCSHRSGAAALAQVPLHAMHRPCLLAAPLPQVLRDLREALGAARSERDSAKQELADTRKKVRGSRCSAALASPALPPPLLLTALPVLRSTECS